MFISVGARAASAYKRVSIETSVDSAKPHELVDLLFDALLLSLATAKEAMGRHDVAAKGAAIGRAVRLIEEGLKGGLNMQDGGDIAANLRGLYSYSVRNLTLGNLNNDVSKIVEVIELLTPVAQAWKQMPLTEATTNEG